MVLEGYWGGGYGHVRFVEKCNLWLSLHCLGLSFSHGDPHS
jgi:hypothetical protein